MKFKCKETGAELRDCVWVYQGTDTNGKLCVVSDKEMESHPDPIGWNIYVPQESVKSDLATRMTIGHLVDRAETAEKQVEELKVEHTEIVESFRKENRTLKDLWDERTEQKNVAKDLLEEERRIAEHNQVIHNQLITKWERELARANKAEEELEIIKSPGYCTVCGSCGEDGCCSPARCQYPPAELNVKEMAADYEHQITALKAENERIVESRARFCEQFTAAEIKINDLEQRFEYELHLATEQIKEEAFKMKSSNR